MLNKLKKNIVHNIFFLKIAVLSKVVSLLKEEYVVDNTSY